MLIFNELLELYVELVNTGNDIILAGDFNIHYLENDDIQAEQFQDIMEAIELQQHVTQMTHKSGNILDLVFTDYQSKISVTNLKVSLFISDHVSIVRQISYEKFPISVSTKSFRDWDVDIEKFCDGLNLDSLDYTMNYLETFLGDWLRKIEHGVEDNVPHRE